MTAADALTAVLVLPVAAAAILALLPGYRPSAWINVAASLATFLAATSLLLLDRPVPGEYLHVDDLNIVFIVLNTFVGFTAAFFSASYIGHELEIGRLTPANLRFYHAMYQIMMFGMNLALISNNIGLMWVAVELATLSTVLMVGLYRTHEALEAAWKYFILGSVGIALALFGTILVYMAAQPVLGEGTPAMIWTNLIANAARFDPAMLNVAFVFLLVGYGTKVGLAPFHAWLPDAHAEGPTPISAVLSGLLLNVALYAVLRFKMLMTANEAAVAPGPLMAGLGLLSLVFAAAMLYRRRDIKRLFAYSSIEHMGIIVFAFGMGGPLANFAGLLHMVMHSLTKSAIFFAVGNIAQIKGTQRLADIRGLTHSHPALGWGLVLAVLSIAGMPPSGVFMSEFLVVTSSFARAPMLTLILVFGLLLAFGALLLRLTEVAFGEPTGKDAPMHGSLAPLWLHISLVYLIGLHMPQSMVDWFRAVAALLDEARMTALPKLTWIRSREFRTRPFAVTTVRPAQWTAIAHALAEGRFTLLSLWAADTSVSLALYDDVAHRVAVARLKRPRGRFPSVGSHHAPAQRLERAAADLFGLTFEGAADARPWLDHGRWDIAHPLGGATPHPGQDPYPFLPVEGESLHQVPVGPVHAGIIESGHFRFTAQGETVVRLEQRLGYVHKGIDRLMQGADLARGAELAARTCGDSTVAYTLAFAQAAEAALEVAVPERAFWLRGLMAELERLANHLGDIGAICNDAAFAMMLAQMSVLRERVLRAAHAVFGHRFMRDLIVPGGVASDLDATGETAVRALIDEIRDRLPPLVSLYDNSASLLDRTVGTGHVSPDLARRFGAGGFVGRASGRDFDARRDLRYAPFDKLRLEVPLRADGDVNARIWIRIDEVEQCCSLITQILDMMPQGAVRAEVAATGQAAEGLGLVEGFRGDILVWLSLDEKRTIRRCHMRDPSWFQWPLLEAAIEGNIIADFPLCNKSFNCSYSGHDL